MLDAMVSVAPTPLDSVARAGRVVRALFERFERQGLEPLLIETHISWVLLVGAHAYKIKKPVRFGFLDFSSLAARQRFCESEVRLNQRLVAELYVGVVPIRISADGPAFEGDGPVIEYAVKMHRLAPLAVVSERLAAGGLDATHLTRLAHRMAAFHRDAPAAAPGSPYATPATVQADASHALDALAAMVGEARCAGLRLWLKQAAQALIPIWQQRHDGGFVREGHGDLHLDNVLVLDADVTAFDCIEFDTSLRWIDVINDIAFLVMDLQAHSRRDLGHAFLNAYLEDTGDYAGVAVLRFYCVYRAIVRSLVAALREH